MKKTQLPSNYSKHKSGDISRQFLIKNFYNILIRTIKPLEPKTILDVGCGEGFTLQKLKENKIGVLLKGIDKSDISIDIGRKMFPDLDLKTGDIYKLSYNKNSFDLVVCSEVLEHLKSPIIALEELKRVSKQYLLLTVPNEPFYRISRFLRGINVANFGDHPEHINHWGMISFKNLIKSARLKITTINYPFPWIMILAEK
ncbi:MAG: class I SAM-dependent methyltransferase [Patescibacteria group bacterium]|nr:class I SAM-dependent methyltransferase [Patescibacteria group bacterium]